MGKYITRKTVLRMRKMFYVDIREVYYKTVTVEAANEKQAIVKAADYDQWASESDLDYCESDVCEQADELEGVLGKEYIWVK